MKNLFATFWRALKLALPFAFATVGILWSVAAIAQQRSLEDVGVRATRLAQPVVFEAELAPPIYSTLAQSGGFKWVAYGYLYPVGTFDGLPPCEQPEGATPIGSYKVAGEWGDAAFHAATYRLTFGNPNDGKQFVFSGIVEYALSELNTPETATYGAARLVRGGTEEGFDAEVMARAAGCFGANVRVAPQTDGAGQ